MPFQEYKSVVGTAAGLVTAAQFFSPVFLCKQIIQQGNTNNIDAMPFVGGFGMSLVMLQHGLMLQDTPMIAVNMLAFSLNLVYTYIYYKYTKDKGALISKLLRTIGFAFIIIAYAQIDLRISPARAEFIYGVIITILIFCLIGAPLMEVKTIIANKNAEKLPFPLILSGTFVTFLWLLYGIIIENIFMQFQNVVGFALSSFQLFLCFKYPSPSKEKAKKID